MLIGPCKVGDLHPALDKMLLQNVAQDGRIAMPEMGASIDIIDGGREINLLQT